MYVNPTRELVWEGFTKVVNFKSKFEEENGQDLVGETGVGKSEKKSIT